MVIKEPVDLSTKILHFVLQLIPNVDILKSNKHLLKYFFGMKYSTRRLVHSVIIDVHTFCAKFLIFETTILHTKIFNWISIVWFCFYYACPFLHLNLILCDVDIMAKLMFVLYFQQDISKWSLKQYYEVCS